MSMTEQQALRALVSIIVAQGYSVSVNDGGDWPVKRSTDIAEICDAASAVGEALLRLRGHDGATAGVSISAESGPRFCVQQGPLRPIQLLNVARARAKLAGVAHPGRARRLEAGG